MFKWKDFVLYGVYDCSYEGIVILISMHSTHVGLKKGLFITKEGFALLCIDDCCSSDFVPVR